MKKTWILFWGFGFIIVAAALVVDAFGLLSPVTSALGEISILALIVGFFLLCFAVAQLFQGNFGNFFVPLALIFMLFEKNIAHIFDIGDENGNIINNWLLLLAAIMLGIGFSILFSGLKRKKRNREDGSEWSCGEKVRIRSNIGSSVKYIDCDGFKYEEIENNLGSYTVFFENVDKYEGDGVLEIENNLGAMTINVPSSWHVIMQIDNSLGASSRPSEDNPDGPVITIKGENNLGSVAVKYV